MSIFNILCIYSSFNVTENLKKNRSKQGDACTGRQARRKNLFSAAASSPRRDDGARVARASTEEPYGSRTAPRPHEATTTRGRARPTRRWAQSKSGQILRDERAPRRRGGAPDTSSATGTGRRAFPCGSGRGRGAVTSRRRNYFTMQKEKEKKRRASEPARVPSPYKLGDSVRGGVYRPSVQVHHHVRARGQRGVTGATTRGACARALPGAAGCCSEHRAWPLVFCRLDGSVCWLVACPF